MKNDLPLDHWQVNAKLIAAQTGSRVYSPGFELMPTPKLSGIVRVAIIFGGSLVGWVVILLFALAVGAVL